MFLLKYKFLGMNSVDVLDAILLSEKPSKRSLYDILFRILKRVFPNSDIRFSFNSLNGVYKLSFESYEYVDYQLDGESCMLKFHLCEADPIEV